MLLLSRGLEVGGGWGVGDAKRGLFKGSKGTSVKRSATVISIVFHRRDFKQVDYTNK